MYKIIKVLNNNTILACNETEEVIIMYKGINYIDPVYLEIASEIIRLIIEKFGKIDNDILLPLADHIYFAIKRMDENIMPLNPFINDIRLLFPDEYEVALEGREVINKFISRMINDDEVGFITLHIQQFLLIKLLSQWRQHELFMKVLLN